jgi:hypothetical protein
MKHNKTLQNQRQEPANALPPATKADLHPVKKEFKPRADDVATRAYFSFVNQGSLPGHDVQHWLEAEVQILAEHHLAQSRGLPARS